jgi:RNA polymerase sigma-70 factor (ECF subfamily)
MASRYLRAHRLDPEHSAEARRIRTEIASLLGRLDDEKRTVFVLYELEELSMSQVAGVVGCPLQTAYSRLHAARKAMRALVQRNRLGERTPSSGVALVSRG